MYTQPRAQPANSLDFIIERYNHQPQEALYGLTPHEVLHGAIPRPGIFAEAFEEAKIARIEANRADTCGVC